MDQVNAGESARLGRDTGSYGRHAIDTPEQIQIEFPLAGIGSRALAAVLDSLIQVAAVFVLVAVLALIVTVTGFRQQRYWIWLGAAFVVLAFLITYGYFILFEIYWNGQTPGKRALRIRVMKESGRPLSGVECVARNLMRVVDQLPFSYGIALVSAFVTKKSQRLGDMVAGSIVVREAGEASLPLPMRIENESEPAALDLPRITEAELAWIDTFLARRPELEEHVRAKMAHEILRRIQRNHSLPAMENGRAEPMLELLANHARSRSI